MKFCTKCGNKVIEGKLFCTSCGNDLRARTSNENESNKAYNVATDKPNESHISNFKLSQLSKKSKIALVTLMVLIVAIVASIQIGDFLSDPNRLVTKFEKAVVSENAFDLASILSASDTRLKVDSKSIAPLLAYFKSNPTYLNTVLENLKTDVSNTKEDNGNTSTTIAEPSNVLTLAKAGKKFFIFPNYKINIKPSYINITTTVKDVTFSINKVEIGKSTDDKPTKEFGPYIPGNYSILASYKGKYVTISEDYPIDLVLSTEGITDLSVFEDMGNVTISSEYPEADIFVNGKNVNVKVKDATDFGPIDSTAKVYATYVDAGKTLKSEETSISIGQTYLNLSFAESANDLIDVQNQLKEVLSNYASYFTEAINANNVSLIDPFVAPESELYKQQKAYIPSTNGNGIREQVVSTEITNYDISDDNKTGSITTSEVYTITAKDGTASNESFNYVYKFQYNDATSSYQFVSINKAT